MTPSSTPTPGGSSGPGPNIPPLTALSDDLLRRYWSRELSPAEMIALDAFLQAHPAERARLRDAAPKTGASAQRGQATPLRAETLLQVAGVSPHVSGEDLEAWVSDTLPAKRRAVVEAHLAVCTECREDADALKAYAAELRGQQQAERIAGVAPQTETGKPERFRGLVWGFGGSVLGAALAAAILVVVLRPGPPTVTPTPEPNSALIAANQRVEELTGQVKTLQERAGASAKEQESLKTQLAKIVAERDRVQASATSDRKRIANLEGQVRTATDERNRLRTENQRLIAATGSTNPPSVSDPGGRFMNALIKKGEIPGDLAVAIAEPSRGGWGKARGKDGFALTQPRGANGGAVVLARRPECTWNALTKNQGGSPDIRYQVTILDASGATVETTTTADLSWRPTRPLTRGATYIVTVEPVDSNGKSLVPPRSTRTPEPPRVTFRVLPLEDAETIANERLTVAARSLALGMITEALPILQNLVEDADDTPAGVKAKQLLKATGKQN